MRVHQQAVVWRPKYSSSMLAKHTTVYLSNVNHVGCPGIPGTLSSQSCAEVDSSNDIQTVRTYVGKAREFSRDFP